MAIVVHYDGIPDFIPSEIKEELTDDAKHIMEIMKSKVCVISEFPNIKAYDNAIRTFANNMLFGFEHKEFRDQAIQYKFNKDNPDEEIKFMSFRNFIINLIMWRPQFCLDKANLDEHLILDDITLSKISPSIIKRYFDHQYIEKYNRYIPDMPYLGLDEINGTLSEILGETNFLIRTTTSKFSNFFGLSADIETFMQMAKENPKIDELMHFRLDESMQPAEMEQVLDESMDTFVKEVKKTKFNKMTPLLAAESGLNMKQVRDMTINCGLKPDIDGRTFPVPINTNFLAEGGLTTLIQYYLDAVIGRKAAIINNEYMGKTGHMLIMVAINSADIKLSKTCMDCGSVNPIPIEVKDKKHLQKLDGRRYRFRGERNYHILRSDIDTNLIGETLEFRSPITCSCKDGVCRECYGDLYYANVDLESAGAFSAIIVMNPVVQGILSAKHHQSTNTAIIKFNPEFNDYFSLYSTEISLASSPDTDTSDLSIVIYRENFFSADDDEEEIEMRFSNKRKKKKRAVKHNDNDEIIPNMEDGSDDDENSDQAMKYFVNKFYVVKNLHAKNVEPEYIAMHDIDDKDLFMHTTFVDQMYTDKNDKGQFIYIDFEDISLDDAIFTVDVENNEVTRPMKAIQRLLNSNNHEGCSNIRDITNKMIDLMIASRLSASAVHGEMIIRNLIRDMKNPLRRPDFNKIIMSQDYNIFTINTALKRNPAITTSISTPYLKYQLVNLSDTFDKTGQSVFDEFYKSVLNSDEPVSEMNVNTR